MIVIDERLHEDVRFFRQHGKRGGWAFGLPYEV